jgi:hypothetical protein
MLSMLIHSSAWARLSAFPDMNHMDGLAELRAGRLAGARRLDLSCGLTEFPREIFDLSESLEVLNLSRNLLSALPADLPRLKKLRILFCSDNAFTELPEVLGECASLSMVGFRANAIETVPAGSLPKLLRWLILTENKISKMPDALGGCLHLQKLMLTGNRLASLPESLLVCPQLEMLRISANDFDVLPEWLLGMPKLAWLALAGNACAAFPESLQAELMLGIPWQELAVEEKIGEGASGEIFRAVWKGRGTVAVKLFKNAVTSDGLPECEMQAALRAGGHAHFIPVHGRVLDHAERKQGLVMDCLEAGYRSLAGPPSFETCTRDVYAAGSPMSIEQVRAVLAGVASAAAHLHEKEMLHGDLYAHNVLWHEGKPVLLGDMGAASCYAELAGKEQLERLEVRAFGYLVEELLACATEQDVVLTQLKTACLDEVVARRPCFAEIEGVLT